MENKKPILAGPMITETFLALSNISAIENLLNKFLQRLPELNYKAQYLPARLQPESF
ncbi:MAG TPA: hypothetical protein PL029_02970 [Bacteroidia bacterium]|nr:hypothetical protein [Bacteroidia bacterium]